MVGSVFLTSVEAVVQLRKLCKDPESNPGGCQTVYLAENGMFAVQGLEMDPETYANMENVLPGEGGVLIKPEIILEAARLYQERSA
ncbi:hypothetical protein GCM10027597_04370 [Saccharopolyspora tripterygii]